MQARNCEQELAKAFRQYSSPVLMQAAGCETRQVVLQAVGQVFGLDKHVIASRKRGKRPIAHARQVAMYLVHISCGLSLTETGRVFGRDRTTVAHACAVIEGERDDPQFDRALDLLAWAVPLMVRRPSQFLQ